MNQEFALIVFCLTVIAIVALRQGHDRVAEIVVSTLVGLRDNLSEVLQQLRNNRFNT